MRSLRSEISIDGLSGEADLENRNEMDAIFVVPINHLGPTTTCESNKQTQPYRETITSS